ncbi:uncharacterized protein HMPREF1541_07750 [Cyphellophora europaea CBS 101466]|uniref:Transcription factor domain-containing protein n=1 Tax=Cyphellophora europaea (strain CBS 101466) TaxID=1220924 RepID=W2RNM3_CYPE1|nr:uncharacterized protein HMPREF1541_07750 [Cyphellophora europaea CBS 101466]ETN38126.1 hypothetical protein HMPREF1541_07750 [Cyphellophora europaea CBS 101466]
MDRGLSPWPTSSSSGHSEDNSPPPSASQKKPSKPKQTFLFVNKNAKSEHLSRSAAPDERLEIRRHVKQNLDRRDRVRRGRRVEVAPSTASRIAREGFQLVDSSSSTSPDSTPSTNAGTKAGFKWTFSDKADDYDEEDHDTLQEHQDKLIVRRRIQQQQQQQRMIQPGVDPARMVDPSGSAPLEMNKTALKVIQLYMRMSSMDKDQQSDLKRAPGSVVRYNKIASSSLSQAFSSRVRLACLIAATGASMAVVYKNMSYVDAMYLAQRAVALTRQQLATESQVSPDHFYVAYILFVTETYYGNTEAAIIHLRAARSVWSQLGGYDNIDGPNRDLFLSIAFFQQFIEYWNADPPIQPFWTPADSPWPPEIIIPPGRSTLASPKEFSPGKSDILSRPDVHFFLQEIVSYAQNLQQVADEETRTFEYELRNLMFRQRLLCLRTNDARVHILRRCLHILVSALAGYPWLKGYLEQGIMFLKGDMLKSPITAWQQELRLRGFCLIVGAIHSSDSWFMEQPALSVAVADGRQGTFEALRRCCGSFVEPNLVSAESLRELSDRILTWWSLQAPGSRSESPGMSQTRLDRERAGLLTPPSESDGHHLKREPT